MRANLWKLSFWIPFLRLLELVSRRIENLPEITLSVSQGNGNERRAKISGRTESVARENSQTPAISGDVWFQSYFHRKIGHSGRDRFLHSSLFTAEKDSDANLNERCLY